MSAGGPAGPDDGARTYEVVVSRATLLGVHPGPAHLGTGEVMRLTGRHWRVELPAGEITGARRNTNGVLVTVGTRGAIELQVQEPDPVLASLADAACRLPELSLALGSLAPRRSGRGDHQTLFFRPLLDARAAVERARTPEAQMRAFDARRIADTLNALISRIARERHPRSPSFERGTEAHLQESVAPLITALGRMAAPPLHPHDVIRAWCDWRDDLVRVFAEADIAWRRIRRYLDASVAP
jgi:hypothetical protein